MPALARPGDRQILKAFAAHLQATGRRRGPDFAILAALLAHANDDLIAWPGYGTIARVAMVSTRTVERRVPELERAGLFRRRVRRIGDRRDRTEYDMSAFVQQSLAFDTDRQAVLTDIESARNGEPVPTESRARTDTESAPVPTGSRAKEPLKKPGKKPGCACRGSATSRRSRFCPDDFELDDELMAWAIEQGFTANEVQREFAKMRDHEYKDPKSDWRRAFKKWMRNAPKYNSLGGKSATKAEQRLDRNGAAFAEAKRREIGESA